MSSQGLISVATDLLPGASQTFSQGLMSVATELLPTTQDMNACPFVLPDPSVGTAGTVGFCDSQDTIATHDTSVAVGLSESQDTIESVLCSSPLVNSATNKRKATKKTANPLQNKRRRLQLDKENAPNDAPPSSRLTAAAIIAVERHHMLLHRRQKLPHQ